MFAFFFFQAEDGIRDYKVTGVQTCALPIFLTRKSHTVEDGELAVKLRLQVGELWEERLGDNERAVEAFKIGRASCRERVGISVGDGSLQQERRAVMGRSSSGKVEVRAEGPR